ncbi:endonuclease IV [Candidatus Parvarchaeota archaeon]|jgi:deoxyribonuclease-4|nr:MAG: endonuclease IV [Candidatus Parvarchaeota archaeon]HIG52068.1 endonuclease IV [Candidatus Pacearchaeota archaeon]
MSIKFGPAGLGSVKTAERVLEEYYSRGFRACEIAFTYGVYIKKEEDAKKIGKKAKELGISLSIHAPYYINLNSEEASKIEASKKRILDCCRVGEILGAKRVIFHPGYYGKNREKAYENIKREIQDILAVIKKEKWKIKLAPETMGKVNVFGSIDEISRLVKETDCSFCIDFAHILAREKIVDYEKVRKLFLHKEWHIHFSGIIYGEKGEKKHKTTEKREWEELLNNLPKDKKLIIINESPTMIDDSLEGIYLSEKFNF